MSRRDNGGPAYPTVYTETYGSSGDYQYQIKSEGGVTVRDYFAREALAALLKAWAGSVDELAVSAYTIADAMLKARGGK